MKISILSRIRPPEILAGGTVLLFILGFYFFALQGVFSAGKALSFQTFWQDQYLRHILLFSFGQAFLSALLAVASGMIFAKSLFYLDFKGKSLLIKICSLTFVLPALVAIFGLIGIYGSSGWLAQLFALVGIEWQPNIYGLTGILIAHLFFNIPLASRMFLQSFSAIPNEQRQLAAQLNLRGWAFFRWVEFPYLRQQIPAVFGLIFMLCFTSFTIVLTLGGSPKYTTLEVAIYQAIMFEFDLTKAAFLAIIQFIFCFILFSLTQIFNQNLKSSISTTKAWINKPLQGVRFFYFSIIILTSLFILLPLVNLVVTAIFSAKWQAVLSMPLFWKSTFYSISIAFISALLSLLMALAILFLSRKLNYLYLEKTEKIILNAGMTVLAIPTLVVAIGLFLLLQQIEFNQFHLFLIIIFCNAFASLPFMLKTLAVPMNNNMQRYQKLCTSLKIQGWQRFRLIEWQSLSSPVKYAFCLAFCFSLGDFTAIALFGNQEFSSLPYLLYQQLGSYRMNEASVTAFILLLLCFMIFFIAERKNQQGIQND